MSLPIYQRVAVTDAGDVIPGAEYTVINENTGVAAPIYSDRTGATLLTAPYFADSAGTIQFFIAQGTTFRVAASGGVGTYTDRYVYGVAEAVLVQADGNVGIGTSSPSGLLKTLNIDGGLAGSSIALDGGDNFSVVYTGATAGDPTAVFSNTGFKFATATAKDATGFSEKMRIDSAGNVGIGNTTPGNYSAVGANNLVVGTNSDSNGVTIVGAAAGYASLAFADGAGTGGASDYSGLIQYSHIANSMNFFTSSLERLRIDSSGNLLVGTTTTNSAVAGHVIYGGALAGVSTQSAAARPLYINRLSSDGDIIELAKDDVKVGSIGSSNNAERLYITNDNTGLSFLGDFSIINPCDSAGAARDNAIDLGQSAARFNDAYITNGVTAGSDRTQKQDILEITKAEYNVAKACKGLLRSFRWIDAVEKKGDDARIHFGIMAQDLQDAFTAEGLDAGRYGMFMSNTWWETHTEVAAVEAVEGVEFVQAVEASEALYSEDGELISEAVEAVEGVEGVEAVEAKDAYTRTDTFYTLAEAPAGATERTRLGVRYTELLAFIIAAL